MLLRSTLAHVNLRAGDHHPSEGLEFGRGNISDDSLSFVSLPGRLDKFQILDFKNHVKLELIAVAVGDGWRRC